MNVLILVGNNLRAQEQRRKEKSLKDEQKRAYGAILQLKQRQRAEVSFLIIHSFVVKWIECLLTALIPKCTSTTDPKGISKQLGKRKTR